MTKTVKKVVAGISALVILGGAAVGAWAVMENSRSSYPSFDQIEADKEYTADLGEGVMDEGGAEISETVENGVQLMSAKIEPKDFAANGVSAQAETAYQLTATITPDNATNKAVDWSVAFVNPSSAWASGKSVTNYVTVTPTSDGALTANVECKQAFGEQIKVTVTSRDNENASASCTIDYAARVVGVTGDMIEAVSDDLLYSFDSAVGVIQANGFVEFQSITDFCLLYSDFTVQDTFSYSVTFSLNDSVLDELNSDLGVSYTSFPISFDSSKFSDGDLAGSFAFNLTIRNGSSVLTGLLWNKVVEWLQDNPSKNLFEMTISCTGEYSDYNVTLPFVFDPDDYSISVTDVSMSDSSIIF